MPRFKEKRKIIHEPRTFEIFHCLSEYPLFSKLLLEDNQDKPYTKFLEWLIENKFYSDLPEKITIRKLAADFKADASKITKWIASIYNDIFDLNAEKPHLFQADGIKVSLYMKHYDSHCYFETTMPVLPREFETVKFYFTKGVVGTETFWVYKVEHLLSDDKVGIIIWLDGNSLNRYREFLLEKGLYQGWIGFMDTFDKHPFEIDEILKRAYPR